MATFKKWLGIASLIAIPFSINADETRQESDVAHAHAQAAAMVFIDPETGELRAPTTQEKAAMAEQFRRKYLDQAQDKPIVRHADGSLSKELGAQHRMYSVARISEDGVLETTCLTADSAAEFLEEKPEPIKQAEESK